jgi:PIN domain nuclease of toxin-antitoxin system
VDSSELRQAARHHESTLVTKDGKLREYPHVQTLW